MIRLPGSDQRTLDGLIRDIEAGLKQPGVVLVEQFGNSDENRKLINVAQRLGIPTVEGVDVEDNPLEEDIIHRVETHSNPVQDEYGFDITSTTSKAFPCHTDQYFSEDPAEVVVLYCVRNDETGGASLIAHLGSVLSHLDAEIVSQLRKPVYPSHSGTKQILSRSSQGYVIQYNQLEIERAIQRNDMSLNDTQTKAISQLNRAIQSAQFSFLLKPKECLIIQNKRVLHGRTSFQLPSDRLLKRIRIRE